VNAFKPAVTKDAIYVRTFPLDTKPGTTQLLALDLSGKQLWKKDGITTDVAVAGDGMLYAGGTNSQLVAMRPNGDTAWTTRIVSGVASPPVIDKRGNLYFGTTDGYVAVVDSAGGLLWVAETSGIVYYCGNMSDAEKKVLATQWEERKRPQHPEIRLSPALDEEGNVIVAASPGIVIFNGKGELAREWNLDGTVGGAPVIGSDGTIYAGTHGAHLRGTIFALQGIAGLQRSSWPMFGHDPQHTSFAEPR
jgi:outer membrane protein assembly factor BamB